MSAELQVDEKTIKYFSLDTYLFWLGFIECCSKSRKNEKILDENSINFKWKGQ
jgi:hypothetical protein